MNTSFEKSKNTTCEWYTPRNIIDPLGEFDLDPASPIVRLWDTAKNHYDVIDDGLSQEWFGRVWLNPPYSKPEIEGFMKRMAQHGNGIALIYSRCDTNWFHDYVFAKADAILFLKSRIPFIQPNGLPAGSPGSGSCLVAYGVHNVEVLENCGLIGHLVYLQRN